MTSNTKTLADTHKGSRIFTSKVNIRQYLTNKREPAELITEIKPSDQNVKDTVIRETYLRKAIFRRLAIKVRRGDT